MIAKVLILLLVSSVHQTVAKDLENSDYHPQLQPFVCERPGNFENPSDLSCKTFYQCISFLESLLPIPSYCPIFTNFDPELQICSLNYTCPVNKRKSATELNSNTFLARSSSNDYPIDPEMEVIKSCTPFKCTSEGIFEDPDSCGKYYVCNKFFGTYVATHSPCPLFAGFDSLYKMCSFAKTCLPSIEECTQQELQDIEESCTYVDYPDYFKCSRSGQIQNLNDPTCKTYHSCTSTGAGTFFKQTFRCPKGSNFNPRARKCDSNYVCPCNNMISTVADYMIPSPINSHSIDEDINNVGSIKNYKDTPEVSENLSERSDLEYIPLIKHNKKSQTSDDDAKPNTVVDLSERSNSESDLRSVFSLESLHIASDLTSFAKCDPSLAQSFECSTKGRFQDSRDLSCQSYFLCSLLRNGSFVKTKYVCPKSSRFNPSLGACDVHYKCPCEDKQTTTTSKKDLCLYEEDGDYFTCTRKGRFENLNDPTCQSYFLCNLMRNGSFVKTKYPCPRSSYFHPGLNICSTKYICRCNSQFTTESTTVHTLTTTYATIETSSQTAMTTGRVCNYEEDLEHFSCLRKGRFENLNDPTCQSYYLCNLLKNGSFIKTRYSCAEGSRFNPFLSVCDTQYLCPCEAYTTTLPSSTIDVSTTSTTSDRITEADDSLTTERLRCNYQKDPEYFNCTNKGRFENLNDQECKSYFLCSLLRNGSFLKTKYSCPNGAYFNPSLNLCSTKYNCPCDSQITTSSTTVHTTAIDETTEITSVATTTTGSVCKYEDYSENFSCPSQGRFENLNDLTCQSYYLCNVLKNGTFIKTSYSCPKGSRFNPSSSICDTQYSCPCEAYTTTLPSSTTDESTISTATSNRWTDDEGLGCNYEEDPEYFTCIKKGRFGNLNDLECKSYFLCNLLRNGSFLKTKYSCPNGAYFNPSLNICSTKYTCPCDSQITTSSTSAHTTAIDETTEITSVATTTTERVCKYENYSEHFSCHSQGRFEDLNDPTCQSYYLCNVLKNGTFIKTSYSCPKGSRFNPSSSVCDTHYSCPCEAYTTTLPSSTIDVSTISTPTSNRMTDDEGLGCNYEEDPEYFNCINKGRFENLNDLECKTYFLCNLLRNGSFLKTKYSCPKGAYFNPSLNICSTKYICPCDSQLTTSSTTVHTTAIDETTEVTSVATTTTGRVCKYEDSSEHFSCPSQGRFENLNDLTCQNYYLCNVLKNGTFIKTSYSCPKGSRFNPSSSICDTQYSCPCEAYTTTLPSSTTDESTISTPTSNRWTDDEGLGCNYEEDPEYFTCIKKGRFGNLNDLECKSYFLCNLLRNGSFLKTKYSCPNGAYFNPSLNICSTKYICPCDSQITTSSTSVHTTAIDETTEITSVATTTTGRVCKYEDYSENFSCPSQGRFENLNDLTCQSYYLCNVLKNGTFIKTSYLCPKGSRFNPSSSICDTQYSCPCEAYTTTLPSSTIDESTISSPTSNRRTDDEGLGCNYEEDPEYFTCIKNGRFGNLNDLECKSYFLCNLLRNGSFLKTKYSCPNGAYFNPSLNICSTGYICPCHGSIKTLPTTLSSTATEATEIASASTKTTGRSCRYEDNADYISCPRKGRFENLNDLSCQSYYLCSLIKNGSLIRTTYSCPIGSRFNPFLSVCDTQYLCPCEAYTTTLASSTIDVSTISTTSSNTGEDSDDVSTTKGETASVSEGYLCNYTEDPNDFICTQKGRFGNLNDATCQSYFLCNLLRNGSYVRTRYNCPYGSRFNPSRIVCDTGYICPCDNQTTTSTTISTSTSNGKTSNITQATTETAAEVDTGRPNSSQGTHEPVCVYEENEEYFSCSKKGRFENLNDPTCRSYFLCNFLRDGSFIKTRYSCPEGSRFNPNSNVCDTNYICPCEGNTATTDSGIDIASTTTACSTSASTERDCIYQEDPEYFTCTRNGTFENQNDLTCQTFYLCTSLGNGTFSKAKYLCSKGLFNPHLSVCDSSFTCPCESLATTRDTE